MNKVGRPTKYKPEYCQMIVDYFSSKVPFEFDAKGKKIVNRLPSLKMFAHSIDVNGDTLVEWEKSIPEFSAAYKKAKELQEEFLLTNGLYDNYAQPFAIFAMKNICGWKDKQELEHSGQVTQRTFIQRAK